MTPFIQLHNKVTHTRIYNYNDTHNLLEALYIESLKHTTFNKFKQSMLRYKVSMKKSQFMRYFIYLEKLLPRYEKLIWNKNYRKMKYKIGELKRIIKKKHFEQLILKIAHFYNVNPKTIPKMIVAFYPIPYGRKINAYSIKYIETIGVFPSKFQSLSWLLSGTILHEISHTIYRLSPIVKQNLLNIKKKRRRTTINEIFATSIGAGWGYKQLTNTYMTRKWYNNNQYDKYAKKVYPRLIKYLNNNKQLDMKFIHYIKRLQL